MGIRIPVAVLSLGALAALAFLLLTREGAKASELSLEDGAVFQEGIKLLSDGKAALAEERFRRILSRVEKAAVRFWLAQALARQEGKEPEAIREATAAIALGFRKPETRGEAELLLGALYRNLGDLSSAEAHLKVAASILPDRFDIQRQLQEVDELKKLGTSASKGAAGSGAPVALLVERAQKLVVLDRAREAAGLLQQAVEKDPKNASAWRTLGYARVRAGKDHLEEALQALDRACELDPKNPRGHLFRGGVLDALGRTDEAVAAFSEGIRRHPPGDFATHMARGFARVRQKQILAARDDFAQALAIDRGSALALEWLARAERALKDAGSELVLDSGWVPFDNRPESVRKRLDLDREIREKFGDDPAVKPPE